jgi:hypothetical protein
MIQLALVVVIAFSLLLVVGMLLRDAFGRRGRSTAAQATELTTPALQAELPSRVLMDRIFAEDDLNFVKAERWRQIKKEFLRERRRLALSWLGQAKREALRILRLHLLAVRADLALHPATELKLIFHTFLFFAVYSLIWSSVFCYGAFWARAFMRNVVTLAGSLSGLGGSILADAGRSGLRVAPSHGRI